ncbi:MAG TPA: ADOP family duplicated permease [Thermoanaerobaculia bacterium]|nr:ADOP family duplicated permease [Thermoanaerobaculia bacterium]
MRDILVALRGLAKARGLALAAIATLALGMAATTVVFCIVDGLVLRPLPFGPRTARLVSVHSTHPTQARDWDDSGISYADLLDFRGETHAFEAIEGEADRNLSLVGPLGAERVAGGQVTPGLFAMLGVSPARGRDFRAEDGADIGHESVAIISDGLWRRRFGADPRIVGRPIEVNGRQLTVIGVMPRGFQFPEHHDVWLPYRPGPEVTRGQRGLFAVGLLREGVGREAAQQELGALAARLAARFPATNERWGVHLLALHDFYVPPELRTAVTTMLAAVGLVLLVACANIAGLLLARGVSRQRELAVRVALGAGRGALVRLLLLESLLLALAGGGAAVLLARAGVDALIASNPEPPPYWVTFEVGGTALLFVLVLCAVVTVACGLVPALRATGRDAQEGVARGGRDGGSVEQRRLHRALVVGQIAASLALLFGAALLTRTARSIDSADAGFDPRPLLSFRIYLPGDRYDDDGAKARALASVAERLAALPGVASAATTGAIPADDGGDTVRIVRDGAAAAGEEIGVEAMPASPNLWATLGRELVAGRTFTAAESADESADVAIVNQRLAQTLWPSADPLERRIGLAGGESVRWLRVVGVAPDLVYEEVAETTQQSRLNLYVTPALAGWRTNAVLVRAEGDPSRLIPLLPRALAEVDPAFAAYDVLTMERRREVTAWGERFIARTFSGLAAASLFLACIGTYGLLSYAVSQRRRELGVRLAIGATAGEVVRLLLRDGARLAALGTLLGVPLALATALAVRGLLFGVSPWEPSLWIGLPATLLAAVLLACYLPARRAGAIEPSTALRQD